MDKVTDQNYAIRAAIELAKANIETSSNWIPQEVVSEFIEYVYDFLVSGRSTEE